MSSVRLFLPIAGAITLVLLPMALLYESSRRKITEARVAALLQAGSTLVRGTLEEIAGHTALIVDQLEGSSVPISAPSLTALLNASLKAYPRYSLMAVVDANGRPWAQVSKGQLPPLSQAWNTALQESSRLPRGELWLSPVLWPTDGFPALLVVRPLSGPSGEHQGTLLSLASLQLLARDFDRSINTSSELQRGFLISGDGRILNRGGRSGGSESFAARFPQVWQQMQRQPSGAIQTDDGIFAYYADQLLPADGSPRDGLFLYDHGQRQARIAVVLQVPSGGLYGSSALTQPLGLAGLLLLYLIAAGASLAIAWNQQRLASLRQDMQTSLERLQAVMGNSGVGMALLDPATGRFRIANPAMCTFLGRCEAELQQSSWQAITHPDDLAIDQQRSEELIAGTISRYRLRKRYRHADGRTIWGDLVATCTRNPDGTVRDVIGQVSDVSELVAKATYVEAASQAGVIGVWDWDVSSNQLRWDAVMYQLYGLEPTDGRQTIAVWEQSLHPDDKPQVLEDVQTALRGWREFQPRFRVVWPDGTIHHLKSRSRTTYAADGTAVRMIGVNYDVTEQAQREEQLDHQRHLLASTLDALLDPVIFLSFDGSVAMLRIFELNNAAALFFARGEAQLLGQGLADLLPQEDNSELHAGLISIMEGSTSWQADEHPLRPAHARARPIYADVRAARVPDGVVLSFRDVSSRRLALASLLASEERFRLLAENVSDVVLLTEAGRISWISPRLRVSLGWEPRQWVGAEIPVFCHPNDQSRVSRHLREAEAGRSTRLRLRARASDDTWHWLELHAGPSRNGEGALVGAVAGFRVIDREVEAEALLQRQARTDPLTGLLNRNEILERLEHLTHQRRQGDGRVAVLFCDIDHFKGVNDSHGHSGGDAVLLALAERLRQCTRANDLVGRTGGDELLVVLPDMPNLETAEAMANKLHHNVQGPVALPGGPVSPTLSIGVTLVEPDEPLVSVVARADQAMYAAKQRGRNRVIAFSGAASPPASDPSPLP